MIDRLSGIDALRALSAVTDAHASSPADLAAMAGLAIIDQGFQQSILPPHQSDQLQQLWHAVLDKAGAGRTTDALPGMLASHLAAGNLSDRFLIGDALSSFEAGVRIAVNGAHEEQAACVIADLHQSLEHAILAEVTANSAPQNGVEEFHSRLTAAAVYLDTLNTIPGH